VNNLFVAFFHNLESTYNNGLLPFIVQILFYSLVICFILTMILSFIDNWLFKGYYYFQRKSIYSKYNKSLLIHNYNIYNIVTSFIFKIIPFRSVLLYKDREKSIYTIVFRRWYRCHGLRIWLFYGVLLSLLFLCIKDSWVSHIFYFFNYQFYQTISLIQSWITNNWIVSTFIISFLGVLIAFYKNTGFKKTVKESQEKELHVILEANKKLYGVLNDMLYELSENIDEVLRMQSFFKGCIYAYGPIEDVIDRLKYKNGSFISIPNYTDSHIRRPHKSGSVYLESYCTITSCQKIRDISNGFVELKTYYPLTILGAYKKGLNKLLVLHLDDSKGYENIEKDMLSKENISDFLDNTSSQAQEKVRYDTELTEYMINSVNELYQSRKLHFESMIIKNIKLVVNISQYLDSFSQMYRLHNKEFLDALAQIKFSK
jgi:hypothetical protein